MSLFRELFAPRAGHASDFLAGRPVYDLVGPKTASGESVSPTSALRLSAYFACIRNVSEDLGKLPVCVVERIARGRRPLPEHPVSVLLDESVSEETGAQAFRETLQAWALSWGNGYAEIVRDPRTKRPLELWPIHPSRVVIRRDQGRLWYDVRPDGPGEPIRFAPSEIFHLRGVGEGPYGYSIVQLAAESIGLGLAAELFGASLFGNDVAIGAVISVAAKMDEGDRKKWREGLQAAYSTSRKAHSPLVLDGDAKISRLGIPPQDAQFLETREFQTEEIARWLRMPPHKIGHLARAQGWSTIEAANSDYVVDTLIPWATRWEGESRRKLLRSEDRGRLTVKHYFQGLLRADYQTRTTGYRTLISAGVMTPNEARELEDMNTADESNADELQVQGATVLLSSLGKEPAPSRPFPPPTGPTRDPEELEDEPAEDEPAEPVEAPEARAVAATVAERVRADRGHDHRRACGGCAAGLRVRALRVPAGRDGPDTGDRAGH